jgi:Glycosyl-4,4'-diaponeurosporenoate acyltransferase
VSAERQAEMADRPQYKAAWIRWLTGISLTVTFTVAVVWGARAFGRSVVFAFAVNWVLMMWAIMFASSVVPLRLPAQYYATRPFEKAGRLYDLLGVRWYRRALRRFLWSANPALLRSQPAARETMIERTKDAETGHLFILLIITGITVWALASGWWDAAGWLLLFNLLHNGYPVLSMRQLRARLNAGPNRHRSLLGQRADRAS